MISLVPTYHETIVLSKPAREVYLLISGATSNKPFLQDDEKNLYFNGWAKEDRFRISLRLRRVNHYLPLVIGQIVSTSSGSILFIDYQLFPATRMLLTLWTILLILGSLMGYYQSQNILLPAGGLGIITLIHVIVRSNFQLQLATTQDTLRRLVSQSL